MKTARALATMLAFGFAASIAQAQFTRTDERPTGISAPVPPLLLSARTVFLSNAGADAGLFPHPFTGTQDRGFGAFLKAITMNKRFTVVDSPAGADLVLELQLMAPLGSLGGNKQAGTTDPLPTFRLVIYDRPTHYVLWTITQTIDPAALQKSHDRNFDQALDQLEQQLFTVTGGAAAPATP